MECPDDDEKRSNARVFLRLRPLNKWEVKRRSRHAVEVLEDGKKVVLDTDEEFQCDGVFVDECTTDQVYEQTCQKIPQQLMNGFHCTVAAYGGSRTGKTHTVIEPDNQGLVYRLVSGLFDALEKQQQLPSLEQQQQNAQISCISYTVRVSVVEVYLERLRDLLHESSTVVRTLSHLTGCAAVSCVSADDVCRVIQRAVAVRTASAVDPNREANRSTLVVQVQLDQHDKINCSGGGGGRSHTSSRLQVYDLLASELMVATPRADVEGFEEASQVSHSLQALQEQVRRLSDGTAGSNSTFPVSPDVPAVAALLLNSLHGPDSAYTTFLLTASPSNYAMRETAHTLQFGHDCRKVFTRPMKHEIFVGNSVGEECRSTQFLRRQGRLEALVKALARECRNVRDGEPHNQSVWSMIDQMEIPDGDDDRPLDFQVLTANEQDAKAEREREQSMHRETLEQRDAAVAERDQLQSDLAILQAQNVAYKDQQTKQFEEIARLKQENSRMHNHRHAVEHNLRISQFRESEAVVFMRQLRRFYFRLLKKTAAEGNGDVSDIALRVPGAPDLGQLVDIDHFMMESGLLEESDVGGDISMDCKPSCEALERSREQTSEVTKQIAEQSQEKQIIVNEADSIVVPMDVAPGIHTSIVGNAEGPDISEARQKIYQTPSGRFVEMRERILEEELLQISEMNTQLRNLLEEEKVNVEALTVKQGVVAAFDKMRIVQETRALKEQLDKKNNDLKAVIWKMNELHMVGKSLKSQSAKREQHVAYLERVFGESEKKLSDSLNERDLVERKLREEMRLFKQQLNETTVPVWHLNPSTRTNMPLGCRLIVPFQTESTELALLSSNLSAGDPGEWIECSVQPREKTSLEMGTQTDLAMGQPENFTPELQSSLRITDDNISNLMFMDSPIKAQEKDRVEIGTQTDLAMDRQENLEVELRSSPTITEENISNMMFMDSPIKPPEKGRMKMGTQPNLVMDNDESLDAGLRSSPGITEENVSNMMFMDSPLSLSQQQPPERNLSDAYVDNLPLDESLPSTRKIDSSEECSNGPHSFECNTAEIGDFSIPPVASSDKAEWRTELAIPETTQIHDAMPPTELSQTEGIPPVVSAEENVDQQEIGARQELFSDSFSSDHIESRTRDSSCTEQQCVEETSARLSKNEKFTPSDASSENKIERPGECASQEKSDESSRDSSLPEHADIEPRDTPASNRVTLSSVQHEARSLPGTNDDKDQVAPASLGESLMQNSAKEAVSADPYSCHVSEVVLESSPVEVQPEADTRIKTENDSAASLHVTCENTEIVKRSSFAGSVEDGSEPDIDKDCSDSRHSSRSNISCKTDNNSDGAMKKPKASTPKLSSFLDRLQSQAQRKLEDDEKTETPEWMRAFKKIGSKNKDEKVLETQGAAPIREATRPSFENMRHNLLPQTQQQPDLGKKWTPRKKKSGNSDSESDSDDSFTRNFLRGAQMAEPVQNRFPEANSDSDSDNVASTTGKFDKSESSKESRVAESPIQTIDNCESDESSKSSRSESAVTEQVEVPSALSSNQNVSFENKTTTRSTFNDDSSESSGDSSDSSSKRNAEIRKRNDGSSATPKPTAAPPATLRKDVSHSSGDSSDSSGDSSRRKPKIKRREDAVPSPPQPNVKTETAATTAMSSARRNTNSSSSSDESSDSSDEEPKRKSVVSHSDSSDSGDDEQKGKPEIKSSESPAPCPPPSFVIPKTDTAAAPPTIARTRKADSSDDSSDSTDDEPKRKPAESDSDSSDSSDDEPRAKSNIKLQKDTSTAKPLSSFTPTPKINQTAAPATPAATREADNSNSSDDSSDSSEDEPKRKPAESDSDSSDSLDDKQRSKPKIKLQKDASTSKPLPSVNPTHTLKTNLAAAPATPAATRKADSSNSSDDSSDSSVNKPKRKPAESDSDSSDSTHDEPRGKPEPKQPDRPQSSLTIEVKSTTRGKTDSSHSSGDSSESSDDAPRGKPTPQGRNGATASLPMQSEERDNTSESSGDWSHRSESSSTSDGSSSSQKESELNEEKELSSSKMSNSSESNAESSSSVNVEVIDLTNHEEPKPSSRHAQTKETGAKPKTKVPDVASNIVTGLASPTLEEKKKKRLVLSKGSNGKVSLVKSSGKSTALESDCPKQKSKFVIRNGKLVKNTTAEETDGEKGKKKPTPRTDKLDQDGKSSKRNPELRKRQESPRKSTDATKEKPRKSVKSATKKKPAFMIVDGKLLVAKKDGEGSKKQDVSKDSSSTPKQESRVKGPKKVSGTKKKKKVG